MSGRGVRAGPAGAHGPVPAAPSPSPRASARGLLLGQSLEIAEDDGNAVLFGQLVHLLVQNRLPVAQFDVVPRRRLSHVGHMSFVGLPPRGGELDGPRNVEGDA